MALVWRQFLDIGSGIPTVGNVHEIAQANAPECRVVSVEKTGGPWCTANSCCSTTTRPWRSRRTSAIPSSRTALLNVDEPIGRLARYHDMLAPAVT
jgi:hypothetical protein